MFASLAVGVVVRKGIRLKQYQDLHNLKISVLRGLRVTPEFDIDGLIIKKYDKVGISFCIFEVLPLCDEGITCGNNCCLHTL